MIITFIVMDAVGVVVQVNVSVPDPCAVQYTFAADTSSNDAGAGAISTVLLDVTPVTLTVAESLLQSDVAIVAVVVDGA